MKKHRHIRGFVLLGMLVVLAALSIGSYLNWGRSRFICSYPKYEYLANGMTTGEVENLLGKPMRMIERDDEMQNFYCAPGFKYHLQAEQCWWYEYRGWTGRIEVYFDRGGRLISTGCGTG